jgi:hypothetical protein
MKLRQNETTDWNERYKGTCENCHKEQIDVRKVKAIGHAGESRGYYDVCFQCIKPVIRFYSPRMKRWMEAPMEIPE